MTDETADTKPAAKRRGGWPAGKPRMGRRPVMQMDVDDAPAPFRTVPPKNPMMAKMKARPNWDSDDFVGVGQDGVDRLKIPQDVVDALHRDGIALQWITKSVRGMEAPQELSKMTRGGWTPVHQSDFDGVLDGMFMSKGIDEQITVDDCLLVARPAELQKKARMSERRDSARPLQIAQEQLGHGIPGVTGSDHRTATGGNMIKQTMERIEIPD